MNFTISPILDYFIHVLFSVYMKIISFTNKIAPVTFVFLLLFCLLGHYLYESVLVVCTETSFSNAPLRNSSRFTTPQTQ